MTRAANLSKLVTDANLEGTLDVTGVLTGTSLDISGDIDVDGTTNLDVVDIDGAVDMASTLTVGGAFTSLGIDDNANALAMTIDSDEKVLIGKTSSNLSTAGSEFASDGLVRFTRSNANAVVNFNKKDNNGDIVSFRKDDTLVGSIGVTSSDQVYFSRATGSQGIKLKNSALMPSNADGGDSDADQDLGSSSVRWKDLYLSSGVFLGGTGSANELTDYEEGTWTPSLGGNASYHNQTGVYTKVGNKVFVRGQISVNLIGTGSQSVITGLPFTSESTSNGNPAGVLGVSYYANLNIAVTYISGYVESAQSRIQMSANATAHATIQYNTGNFFVNSSRLDFSMTYRV